MRWFRRPAPEPYRFTALADYIAERARGIVHTSEYQERMAREQAEFDAELRQVTSSG